MMESVRNILNFEHLHNSIITCYFDPLLIFTNRDFCLLVDGCFGHGCFGLGRLGLGRFNQAIFKGGRFG